MGEPRERPHDLVVCGRPVEREIRRHHPRPAEIDGGRHLANRRDPGDRLLREGSERVRHGADEASLHIDRAPAHPPDDTRLGERPPLEPCEDQVAARAEYVPKDADDVRAEILERFAREDRAPRTHHAGPDVAHRQKSGRLGRSGAQDGGREDDGGERQDRSAHRHSGNGCCGTDFSRSCYSTPFPAI
jgi:hypothetical protein